MKMCKRDILITQEPDTWQHLQKKVACILKQSGFAVEIEKKMVSIRGSVEIDVYGEEFIDGRKYSVICECKNWKNNIPQTIIHGFRTVVLDLGVNKGYIITTSKFQSGAVVAVDKTSIELLEWIDFQNLFFESWYENYFYGKISNSFGIDEYTWICWYDSMTEEEKNIYKELRDKINDIGEVQSYFKSPFFMKLSRETWDKPRLPLRVNYSEICEFGTTIPDDILDEEIYDSFLAKFEQYHLTIATQFKELEKKYRKEGDSFYY